jgi:hypothetical protein
MRQKESLLKKYLVVKMAEGWSQVVNWVVMPGLYTMEAAQQFVASAVADEPGARYMIQEVGAAGSCPERSEGTLFAADLR